MIEKVKIMKMLLTRHFIKELQMQKIKERDYSLYIGIILMFAIEVIGIYLISNNLKMNDAFWHIKTGQWVSEKGVINKCYGSWILSDESWIAHEWLFGWFIYQISKFGMNNVVRVFCLLYLITVLICLLQGGILKKNERPPMLYWEVVLVFQFSIYALGMTARPQYITSIFIALYLLILNKSLHDKIALLYILPVMAILWVNIHGGTSLLSYIMIFVYLLCNVVNWDIGKINFHKAGKKWIFHCIIVLILTIMAILINPYGYKMLIYPYTNMQDSLMISMISEWDSPDAKDFATLLFQIIPMLLGIVALIQYEGKIKSQDIAIFFLYIILYLRSIRFYPFLVIVQTCLIVPYAFHLSMPFKFKRGKKEKTDNRMWNNLSIILIGCLCIIYSIYTLYNVKYEKIQNNKELPDVLLQVICEDNPMRIFNHYNAGGYLLFNNINVFVDGRYEPYNQKNVINDYVRLISPSNIEEYDQMPKIINKYKFDAFLISPKNVSLAAYLEKNEELYELKYKDENWLYYECKK